MTRIVVGIPARMGSTRFPGKPLCDIDGKPMIEHCFRRASLSPTVDEVFVAACDEEVVRAVAGFGGRAIWTDPEITRPSLRVEAAAHELDLAPDDIVVVLQGDEPLVFPEMIDLAVAALLEDPRVLVSNLCAQISEADWQDPAEIKVVCDLKMDAMYMSRAPIPSTAHEEERAAWWKQVCIMPFRWHFLQTMNNALAPTPLELQESIEMLRPMQHGIRVRMVPSPFVTKSVDTDADRLEVVRLLAGDPIYPLYRGM